MYRKVLITALMLSISVTGFSQTSEVKNVNPKELAKTIAENSQKELLNKMQRGLKGEKGCSIKSPQNEQQQFLYQENLIDSVLKAKSHLLKTVYDKLRKEYRPTELVYEVNNINIGGIELKSSNPKKGTESYIVPVSFEAHTVAKDGISDVKYAITFNWEAKVKAETENTVVDGKKTTRIVGYVQDGDPTLVASVSNPIKYLTSEKEAMKTAAKNAIIEWYANLPGTLDSEYVSRAKNDKAIAPIAIAENDIKIEQNGTSIIAKQVKPVTISIDPEPYMTEPKIYYGNNPVATLTVTPSFNIVVSDDFKTIESMNVTYDEPEPKIEGPKTEKEKLEMRDKAVSTIKELGESLSAYVGANDKEQKNAILAMFVEVEKKDKSAVVPKVETSYKYKNGNETVNSKKNAEMYLNRLKGSELTFVDYKMMDEEMIDNLKTEYSDKFGSDFEFDSNLYTVMFLVNQRYESRNYKDNTKKVVFMKYQDSGKYLIEKIEVVPNSTKLE